MQNPLPVHPPLRDDAPNGNRAVDLIRNLTQAGSFKQCIEAVQRGQDPVGIIRDPKKNEILSPVPGEFQVG